jgi:hypothetical protein
MEREARQQKNRLPPKDDLQTKLIQPESKALALPSPVKQSAIAFLPNQTDLERNRSIKSFSVVLW